MANAAGNARNGKSKKWTMPLRGWKPALTLFTIQFEGRMPEDRDVKQLVDRLESKPLYGKPDLNAPSELTNA